MPVILRSLGRSSCAISTSLISIRRVPSSVSICSRIAQTQGTNLSCPVSINARGRHQQMRLSSSDQKAKDLNQQGIDDEMSKFNDDLETDREKQARTPWHREGADQPPVSRVPPPGAMTKGRMLADHLRHGLNVGRQAFNHSI